MIFKLLVKLEQVDSRSTRVKHQNPSSDDVNEINSTSNDDNPRMDKDNEHIKDSRNKVEIIGDSRYN